MLSRTICGNYRTGVARLGKETNVLKIAESNADERNSLAGGALFLVDSPDFLHNPTLAEEIFGPAAIVVRCRNEHEFGEALTHLEGQLTATLHIAAEDHVSVARLLPILERKAGRILVNGWPTGVEVSSAMVHGGPYPATSDSRTTSVGTLAIEHFLRPVCYQTFPTISLSPELQQNNPLSLRRMIDGKY